MSTTTSCTRFPRDIARKIARASALAGALVAAAQPGPAQACGGAFFASADRYETVAVRGHQMAVSISKKQTVVWDRIEVTGNPSELAWVIPAHRGAKLELSSEQWFNALATTTQASIRRAGEAGGGSGGGGGCGSSSDDSASQSAQAAPGGGDVTVVGRTNVGPYDVATLRANAPGSIRSWLLEHAFNIPDDIGPVLDEYTSEGFDFIALRVRPGAASVGLQPLRLTTPGADPTLPLRMSRAGVRGSSALTLFVLGEGRYRVQGFEEVAVDRAKLAFGPDGSNYEAVVQAQMIAGGGRRFVVEHASHSILDLRAAVFNPGEVCRQPGRSPSLGGDDGGLVDAAPDAQPLPAPEPQQAPDAQQELCAGDDLAVALDGVTGPLWVTRLRAQLPASAFAADLRFEASPSQEDVVSDYFVAASGGAMIAPARPGPGGTFAILGLTILGVGSIVRRRRHPAPQRM